jgi:hypothetical protein
MLAAQGNPEQAQLVLDSASNPAVAESLAPVHYRILHQLGHPQEAWDFIRPRLGKNTAKRLDVLAKIGIEFYIQERKDPAIAVYQQLVNFQPDNARYKSNLAYMYIGEERYPEAEILLNEAIHAENSQEFGEIARTNLAYLLNITGHYSEAFQAAQIVINSSFVHKEAILRSPFWIHGKMQLDPAQFPGRQTQIGTAALSAGVAAALALGQLDVAEKMALEIKDENIPNLRAMVLGSLEQAKGNFSEVIRLWKAALKSSKSKSEKTALLNWIGTEKAD